MILDFGPKFFRRPTPKTPRKHSGEAFLNALAPYSLPFMPGSEGEVAAQVRSAGQDRARLVRWDSFNRGNALKF